MRTVTIIEPNKDFGLIKDELGQMMVSNGFAFKTKKGIWKKGSGWLTNPQFFNFKIVEGKLHIESWMASFTWLPGVYFGESGLNSGWGWAIKMIMRNVLREIIARYKKEGTEVEGYAPKEKK